MLRRLLRTIGTVVIAIALWSILSCLVFTVAGVAWIAASVPWLFALPTRAWTRSRDTA